MKEDGDQCSHSLGVRASVVHGCLLLVAFVLVRSPVLCLALARAVHLLLATATPLQRDTLNDVLLLPADDAVLTLHERGQCRGRSRLLWWLAALYNIGPLFLQGLGIERIVGDIGL